MVEGHDPADDDATRRHWPAGVVRLAMAAVFAVVVFVVWLRLGVTSPQTIYDFYFGSLLTIHQLRAEGATAGEWEMFRNEIEATHAAYLAELERTASAESPVRQELLYVARDHFDAVLNESGPDPGRADELIQIHLANVRQLLIEETGPPPEPAMPDWDTMNGPDAEQQRREREAFLGPQPVSPSGR